MRYFVRYPNTYQRNNFIYGMDRTEEQMKTLTATTIKPASDALRQAWATTPIATRTIVDSNTVHETLVGYDETFVLSRTSATGWALVGILDYGW
jgi:hypothetical protein